MNLYFPQLSNSPDGIIIVPSSSPTVNPKSTPFCEIMAVWFSAFIILVPENDIVIGSDIPDWPDIINNATGVLAYVVPLKDIVFIPVSEEKTIDFIYTLSLKLLFIEIISHLFYTLCSPITLPLLSYYSPTTTALSL